MVGRMKLSLVAVASALSLLAAPAAHAVDAPKWVAAMHIAAQNSVGLRWTPVAGATEYKILRSTTQGSGHAEIAGTAQPQHFDATVEPGEVYFYVLQAVAGGEVSANSAEKSVNIPGEKKQEALAPPVMKDLTLTQTTEFGKTVSKIGAFWGAPAGTVIAYNVYRSTVPGKDYSMVTSTNEMQYVDADVEVGKTYYYVVTALDQSFQETPYSAEKSVEVKAAAKVVKKKRKAKIKLALRRSKLVKDLRGGTWGELKQPTALAIAPNGDLFVTDSQLFKVFVFNQAGEFLFSFGERGKEPGQFNVPLDAIFDPDGNLWVSDKGNQRITIFSDDGQVEETIEIGDLFDDGKTHSFSGIFCAPDSWFLSDDQSHEIYELEYGSNKILNTIGGLGKEPGQFRGPSKLYFSEKEQALVVADMFNFRVQTFRDLEPDVMFGTYGNSVTQFSRVFAAADDDMGNILTIDFGNQTAQAFGYDGAFKYVMGTENGEDQIPMAGATHITIKGKRVYIVNQLLGSVMFWEMTDEIGPPVKKKKAKK